MTTRAEYLVVLTIKEGQEPPSIDALGEALEVGTHSPLDEYRFVAVEQMVVKEPTESEIVAALEQSRARLIEALNSARAADAMQVKATVAMQVERDRLADVIKRMLDHRDGQIVHRASLERAQEALREIGQPHSFFMVQWENAALAEFCTLDDITSANDEVDPELCAWAREAKVGESHVNGGGAAPMVTTWRIS